MIVMIVMEDPDLYLANDRHGGPRPIPEPMIVMEDQTYTWPMIVTEDQT